MDHPHPNNESKRFWSRPPPPPAAAPLDPDEVCFIERCSGLALTQGSLPEDARTCLVHLQTLVSGTWRAEWDGLVVSDYMLPDGPRQTIRLCHEVAAVLRQHGGLSLCRLIQALQVGHVLRDDTALREDPAAHSLIFSMLGWLSLLYIPALPDAAHALQILSHQPSRAPLRSRVADIATRPLDELLLSLGDLLPRKMRTRASDLQVDGSAALPIKFSVSHLNVAALKDMAGVQIVWVDALSSHLAFDPSTPALSIFKCPSFCKLHGSNESILATVLHRFYEEDEKPSDTFCVEEMLIEVIRSYDLLFCASRRARKLYNSSERARASLAAPGQRLHVDPYLDELCGHGLSTSAYAFSTPARVSYDSETDFPIFKDRLRRIQDYMNGVQPNGFLTLWRDQRDMRLWYTIWAVIILTVIGLVIAVVSMLLAAVQINLARMALKVQQEGA